jgi:hypothetical protein
MLLGVSQSWCSLNNDTRKLFHDSEASCQNHCETFHTALYSDVNKD